MKDDLDPNGILSPGRSGVWPKRYRNKGFELGIKTTHAETVNPVLEKLLEAKKMAKPKRTYGTDELRAQQKGTNGHVNGHDNGTGHAANGSV